MLINVFDKCVCLHKPLVGFNANLDSRIDAYQLIKQVWFVLLVFHIFLLNSEYTIQG